MATHARGITVLGALLLLAACERRAGAEASAGSPTAEASMTIDHQVQTIDGETVSLASYRGRALLIVNTASECGLTPQYKDLQELYDEYKDRGLEVLAFPSNDFGEQEPGTPAEIKAFATETFGVTFPLFAKVHALGPDIAPLYEALTTQAPEGMRGVIEWNFTKFLVDPEGSVVARFDPRTRVVKPRVRAAIEAALPKAL